MSSGGLINKVYRVKSHPAIDPCLDRSRKRKFRQEIAIAKNLFEYLCFEGRMLLIWIKLSIWHLTTKFRPGYESFHETCNDRLRTFEAITAHTARFHHAEYAVFYMVLKMFSIVQVVLGVHTSWRRKWSSGDSTGSLVTSGQPEYYFMSY